MEMIPGRTPEMTVTRDVRERAAFVVGSPRLLPFNIPVAGADRYAASPLIFTVVGPVGALPSSLKVERVSPMGPVPVQSVWMMRLLSMTSQGEGPSTHWSTFTGASVADRSVPTLSVWKTGAVVNKVPKKESSV